MRASLPARGRAAAPALVLLALLDGAPARGSSVDYGDMEQLFGEPITTSATGRPQRASQVPANMEIITAEQIRRSGYDNLPDILRLVPGVDVRRYGFAAADVSVRGYSRPSNPRLLVLVNGQQVYLDLYGLTSWYALPVELGEIRQVEVIKGPNSALFGFNAVSGVINIVTYNPLHDSVNAVTARGGTQSYGALSAIGTARLSDAAGVRLSAGGFRAEDFSAGDLDPRTLGTAVEPRRGSLALDSRFRIAPGVEAVLSGSAADLRSFGPVASPYYAAGRQRTNALRGAVTAGTAFGTLGLNLYRNRLHYGYESGITRTQLGNTVTVAQASHIAKLGPDHAVRLGLEYRDNVMDVPGLGSRIGYHLYSASLMWDWQIAADVSLTNAARIDRMTLNQDGPLLPLGTGRGEADYDGRTITEPSFNSGLVWRASETDTLRLTLARGLEAPSLFALGTQEVVPATRSLPNIALLGSPRLDPSVVLHSEIGYDRKVEAIASVLRAAVFAQRTENVIADPFSARASGTRQGVIYQSANIGDSAAAGGELGLRGEASGLRWNGSYALVSISDDLAPGSRLRFSDGTPTHVVQAGAGFTWDRLDVDAQARWQSRYRDVTVDARTTQRRDVDVADFFTLDARVGYRITEHASVSVTGQQFHMPRLLQTAGRPVERRLFLTLTAEF